MSDLNLFIYLIQSEVKTILFCLFYCPLPSFLDGLKSPKSSECHVSKMQRCSVKECLACESDITFVTKDTF